MQDNLKDDIANRREDFEVYDFQAFDGWSALEPRLKPTEKTHFWLFASGVAASLLVVLVASFWSLKKEQGQLVLNPEWLEAEQYYQQEIDAKWLLIRSKVNDEQLLADIQLMDQAFAELKKDLQDNVDNEEVITAMMDSYRLKLKVLDRMLEKIEDQKEHETDTLTTL